MQSAAATCRRRGAYRSATQANGLTLVHQLGRALVELVAAGEGSEAGLHRDLMDNRGTEEMANPA